jgi:hypothetical protein
MNVEVFTGIAYYGVLRNARPSSTGDAGSRCSRPEQVAQLAFRNANNDPLIVGPVISLAPRHAKVRGEGYRR